MSNIGKFVSSPEKTIYETLKMIDENHKGFLIIVDSSLKVLGTLTDGDIRRAFIHGASIDDSIQKFYTADFKSLSVSKSIFDAIELFKNYSINFLPIVSNDKKLLNIVTKQQLHAILLQDIKADLSYDFTSLDDNIINHEIFRRPWGFYKTTVMNDYFQSKIICIFPGQQLSLQSHSHREEYWIIAHGAGTVQLGDSLINVTCGSSLFIPKGCKHRLSNNSESESLIVTEVQIGDYFGEDDIVRYDDIYGRK